MLIVVATRVITDNNNGKIELVSNHTCDWEKVPGISIVFHKTNTIIRINRLQITQAIKLHREFIITSQNDICFGQNDIIYFLFL